MAKKHIEDEHLKVDTPEPPQEMDPSREPNTADKSGTPWPATSDCREDDKKGRDEKLTAESDEG